VDSGSRETRQLTYLTLKSCELSVERSGVCQRAYQLSVGVWDTRDGARYLRKVYVHACTELPASMIFLSSWKEEGC
jgi:hypothetical protein